MFHSTLFEMVLHAALAVAYYYGSRAAPGGYGG